MTSQCQGNAVVGFSVVDYLRLHVQRGGDEYITSVARYLFNLQGTWLFSLFLSP